MEGGTKMSELSYPHICIIEQKNGFYVFDEIGKKFLTEALSQKEAIETQRKIVEGLRLAAYQT